MDETQVKQAAERHGAAVVAGDLKTSGADLLPEAMAQAPNVMKNLPRTLTGAEVIRIVPNEGEYEVYVNYVGEDTETIVISTWVDQDGTPKISNLSLG